MPKVSICIPTYENAEEVRRLLISIKEQTFQDTEIIISDDSRGKEIEEMLLEMKGREEEFGRKLKYTHNKQRLGHIFNWNAALEKAGGEYIKIMFSDDWFTRPDSLEKMVGLLEENPQAGMVFSASLQVSEKETYARKPEAGYIERLEEDFRYVFISNQIGAPSDTLYRNKEGIRFDEKSNWASDVFLYLEIFTRCPLFVSTNEPLIAIGIHENQYTESFEEKDDRIYADYRYLFQKYKLEESRACRTCFLERYLIPFGKGKKEAIKNGYAVSEYRKAFWRYYRNEVWPCYVKAVVRKAARIVGKGRKE